MDHDLQADRDDDGPMLSLRTGPVTSDRATLYTAARTDACALDKGLGSRSCSN